MKNSYWIYVNKEELVELEEFMKQDGDVKYPIVVKTKNKIYYFGEPVKVEEV